jgi:hypothetical protein
MPDQETERQAARQGRTVALVIAGTILLWMLMQYLGATLGWEARYVFLFDFAALAALFWSLVVVWQIWKKTRNG